MLNRILTVAGNGWVELVRKWAFSILAAMVVFGFWAPILIQYRGLLSGGAGTNGPLELQSTLLHLDQLMLFVGLCASILFAANSVESEVGKRTLSSVMIRPLHRWEYLAGRALSVVGFFLTFALAAVLCSYAAGLLFHVPLPSTFWLGILQRIFRDAAWIVIALSLGATASSAAAVTLIVTVTVLSTLAPHLPNDIHWTVSLFKQIIHYATPAAWMTDFLSPAAAVTSTRALLNNAAVALDNLMYAAVVFIAASWVFTRRDLKLRD